MREILFRGKAKCNGEWVYGDLVSNFNQNNKGIYDYGRVMFNVFPETIGQYTGLTDSNGKKIFEGDIVKHFNNSEEEYDIGAIYFDTDFVEWRRTTQGRFHKISIITSYKLNPTCIYEVIGNIHDNPELMVGDAND